MISSVSSMSSSMSTMSSSATQRQPPPPPDKDVFKMADSDSSGLVSSSELESLVSSIEEVTGSSIDVDDALSSYDADGDGSLNGEEMHGLMASQGFLPSEMISDEGGDSGMQPPPPPSTEQAMSAYSQYSGEDSLSQLIDLLQGKTDSTETYSSLEVTA